MHTLTVMCWMVRFVCTCNTDQTPQDTIHEVTQVKFVAVRSMEVAARQTRYTATYAWHYGHDGWPVYVTAAKYSLMSQSDCMTHYNRPTIHRPIFGHRRNVISWLGLVSVLSVGLWTVYTLRYSLSWGYDAHWAILALGPMVVILNQYNLFILMITNSPNYGPDNYEETLSFPEYLSKLDHY